MKKDSKIIKSGRGDESVNHGINPPVERASTILFPSVAAMRESVENRDDDILFYGRRGTRTKYALTEAINALDGGAGCAVFQSGMAAITTALLSQLRAGDQLLMVDTVYDPVRSFCDLALKTLDVETRYYDPLAGSDIADLITEKTRIVYVEAPGSLTFEMQDIPAIAQAAHDSGACVIMDNTWATPLFCDALALGVDIVCQSATKYIAGHSDIMLGLASANKDHWPRLQRAAYLYGQCASPDDLYLAMRGLRTMPIRMQRHRENAQRLIDWLKARDEVERILYPPEADDPGHALWKRDFTGASGLFGVVLREATPEAIAAMIDDFEFFGLGFSWGGFESLVLPADVQRTATDWPAKGRTLRFHAGLEDADDLIADLDAGLGRFNKVLNR